MKCCISSHRLFCTNSFGDGGNGAGCYRSTLVVSSHHSNSASYSFIHLAGIWTGYLTSNYSILTVQGDGDSGLSWGLFANFWGDLCSISHLFNDENINFKPFLLVQSRRRSEGSLSIRIQGCKKQTDSAWAWRWRHCVLSKRRHLFASHQGVASQKTWIIFILLFPSFSVGA